MDNITHSLTGMVIAETAWQWRGGKTKNPAGLRTALWAGALAASNLPDFDFLYTSITDGKLGYLVHHRGHTHTLVAVLPLTLCIVAALWGWARWKGCRWDRRDWSWLAGLTAFSLVLHIGMDWLNSYGIHPFWPFHNRWYYGDSVFIVEPLLWVAFIPPLLHAGGRTTRIVLGVVFFGGILLCWFVPFVPWYMAFAVTLLGLVPWAVGFREAPRARLLQSLGVAAGIVCLFIALSGHNRAAFAERNTASASSLALRDIILSPLPANPFCWMLMAVEAAGDTYRVRRAVMAAVPAWVPADRCPKFRMGESTVKLAPVAEESDARVKWVGEYRASLAALKALSQSHCGISALLKFARAPFVIPENDDLFAGDLRYDLDETRSFAEMSFPRTMNACPKHVPPWDFAPRALLATP